MTAPREKPMSTTEKLSNKIAVWPMRSVLRELMVEAKAEIERLEKQNTLLKSALIAIVEVAEPPGEDHSWKATRIAREALKE